MKVCSSCKENQPLDSFYKWNRGKDGLRAACKVCTDSRHRKYVADNLETVNKYKIEWARSNPESVRVTSTKRDKGKLRFYLADRRAKKIRATPKWLTEEQREEMKKIYKNCPKGYHVDHLAPLRGESVCGLHVPWNLQYLPAIENIKKGNRF